MFTGLIEGYEPIRGITRRCGGATLEVGLPSTFNDVEIGDSIAVDGVCLTVVGLSASHFSADVSEETLARSTLGGLFPGANVNLERAMRADSRFGGHMVSGHVDGVSTLLSRTSAGASVVYRFSLPGELAPFVVEKGSIALAGISLTVASVDDETFTVAVIPHTEKVTSLGALNIGSSVNFEVDTVGRYIVKALTSYLSDGLAQRERDTRLLDLLGGM